MDKRSWEGKSHNMSLCITTNLFERILKMIRFGLENFKLGKLLGLLQDHGQLTAPAAGRG